VSSKPKNKQKSPEQEINSSLKEKVHIRKVILENFLSFERDEVDFEDSKFIIIIGPNWSGKTSIFQAIKFALGSNERGDRYQKWSNFIRHNQDHAMVELHIQKEDKLLKIRRTVVRGKSPQFTIQYEGDSEFHGITAHEIQELVQKLGYNPDNHFAIVSQGEIDSIKNLKPTQLCSFIEEGIGLKGLRTEILQQKNNVENLNKELQTLKSKKNTLNINLELLRPKLERLEEKKKLRKQKEKYNDELLWANRQNLLLEIVDLAEKVKNLKAEIKNMEDKKEGSNLKVKKLRNEIEQLENKNDSLSKKLGEYDYKKNELVDKIQAWQQEKVTMKEELKELSEKIKKEQKILNNLQMQEESVQNELKIIKSEKQKIESKFDILIKEQSELSEKKEENNKFITEYDRIVSEKKDKEHEIDQNEEKINVINDQIKQIFQSFEDIEHKLQKDKNKWFLENPTRQGMKQLDIKIEKISRHLFDIEEKINKLEHQKSRKFNEFKQLQSSLRERKISLPTNINVLKEEIRKRELKAKGPIIEFLKYKDNLSYAIESVLGEKLLYSFVAQDWDTLELLKRLKNKFNAYCNVYVPKNQNIKPLRSIEGEGVIGYLAELINIVNDDLDVKKVIYSKVKNCLVVKDYRSGRKIYNTQNFRGKCVTLKGEQIISYKYVYETPYSKRLKGLLSTGTQKEHSEFLESEIKSMNEEITELKVKAKRLDENLKELYRKKKSFNDLLYSFKQKQRLTEKKNKLYEKRAELEELNDLKRKKVNEDKVKIEKLEAQKDPEFFKWNQRLKEIPKELKELNSEKKKWEERLGESQKILDEVKEKSKKQKQEYEKLQAEHKKKEEEFRKADFEAFDIYRNIEKLEADIDEISEKIQEIKKKKFELQEEKHKIEKKRVELDLELDQKDSQLKNTKYELESKNEDLDRINKEIGTLVEEKKIEPRPKEEIKADIIKIDKELLKYYDVDESILMEKEQIVNSLKNLTRNQEELQNDIESAIKAEDKMEEKYYDKFKKVLNDLQEKINKKFNSSDINVSCSLDLIGTFEELGVEIKAATSNENFISASALSGGQISMVSIGLILSLQEIQPSPLCMFDEPGMFLDDKNSEVTYQLIKSTLEENPIQMMMFLPKSLNILYELAEKLIGVARVGKREVSTVFKPKIIEN